jgi:hypothetical protein
MFRVISLPHTLGRFLSNARAVLKSLILLRSRFALLLVKRIGPQNFLALGNFRDGAGGDSA